MQSAIEGVSVELSSKCGHDLRKFNVMMLNIEQSSFQELWDTGSQDEHQNNCRHTFVLRLGIGPLAEGLERSRTHTG